MLQILAVLDGPAVHDDLLDAIVRIRGSSVIFNTDHTPPRGMFPVLMTDAREEDYAREVRGLRFWVRLGASEAAKLPGILCAVLPHGNDPTAVIDYIRFLIDRERIAYLSDPLENDSQFRGG